MYEAVSYLWAAVAAAVDGDFAEGGVLVGSYTSSVRPHTVAA